jgi:hypothetical protein
MGKQQGPSKKTIEKEKKKIIEDKTFGLKNKNKSKSVQKQVQQVKNAVNQIHDKKAKKEQEEKEKKRLQKLMEKQREAELKALFRTVEEKKPEQQQQQQEEADQEEEQEDMFDQIEEELKNEAEMTLEEIVEVERAKIIEGTPVTWESFQRWKEFKNAQKTKEEEVRKKAQMEIFKRSGVGLSGRELFEYNQSLFVDDEEAEVQYEISADIDDDLFLNDEEGGDSNAGEGASSVDTNEGAEEYDPATWKDPNNTPKVLLTDLQSKLKIKPNDQAKFEVVSQTPTEGFIIKCILPHLNNMEFVTPFPYKQKKTAEHNAALMAYNYMMKLEQEKQ